MNDPEKKPGSAPLPDAGQGGFSNLDDEIRAQQEADVKQEREDEATPPADSTGKSQA